MSTGNIISIERVQIPLELIAPELSGVDVTAAVAVTFKTRQGSRTYAYIGPAANAILDGDDPAHYQGILLARAE